MSLTVASRGLFSSPARVALGSKMMETKPEVESVVEQRKQKQLSEARYNKSIVFDRFNQSLDQLHESPGSFTAARSPSALSQNSFTTPSFSYNFNRGRSSNGSNSLLPSQNTSEVSIASSE